jgi:hypothetical protein
MRGAEQLPRSFVPNDQAATKDWRYRLEFDNGEGKANLDRISALASEDDAQTSMDGLCVRSRQKIVCAKTYLRIFS